MSGIGPKDINLNIDALLKSTNGQMTNASGNQTSQSNSVKIELLKMTSLNESTNILQGWETFSKNKDEGNKNED